MKEIVKSGDNGFGIIGVVFGILSVVFFLIPVFAVILSVIGLIFSLIQRKKMPNAWATAGLWLNGIGIIVGLVWNIYYIKGILNYINQYQQLQGITQRAGALDTGAYANYGS